MLVESLWKRKWQRRVFLRDCDGMRPNIHFVGKLGEDVACSYLKSKKIKVLYRNFSAPNGGELDIVARKGALLLFIEVKARFEPKEGRPLEAVNRQKRSYMKRAAGSWLKLLGRSDIPYQFDVIEVVLTDGERPLVNRVENIEMEKINPLMKSAVQAL